MRCPGKAVLYAYTQTLLTSESCKMQSTRTYKPLDYTAKRQETAPLAALVRMHSVAPCMCYSEHPHHKQPGSYELSSPLVVESMVLHSLVREVSELVVRRGHMCLVAFNNSVLILHLTAHSLHIHDINFQRPHV